ncbi:MAG: hypothetical protein ACM359_08285 [Bacillota bacterium]
MNTPDSDHLGELDRATTHRLSRLASFPVDTSKLAATLRQQIPAPQAEQPRHMWLRPMRIAAAILVLIGGIIAALIFSSGGPALASPDVLAHVHEEMIAGQSHGVRKVTSIDAAAAALSEEWPQRPALPDMPEDHVMSCCVHEVGRKKMACIALMVNEIPITMAVADSSDIKTPEGTVLVRDGITYRVQSSGGVNMAMTERNGRWICLMGRLPVEQLIQLSSKLHL